MDFAKEYQQKLVSADEAVKCVKSGDWVDYSKCWKLTQKATHSHTWTGISQAMTAK